MMAFFIHSCVVQLPSGCGSATRSSPLSSRAITSRTAFFVSQFCRSARSSQADSMISCINIKVEKKLRRVYEVDKARFFLFVINLRKPLSIPLSTKKIIPSAALQSDSLPIRLKYRCTPPPVCWPGQVRYCHPSQNSPANRKRS